MSSEFLMDESCFACGNKNDNGLKLKITECNGGVCATINLPSWSGGYQNIVHGGIIATILDEMAVWAAFKRGYKSVTGELNMRIKRPMAVGQTYRAEAMIVNLKHQLIEAKSTIVDENRRLVASATVKLLRTK
jgi:uncharacterized protein (TIGR00369 family)